MTDQDPWFSLRQFTQARIGQGRAGCATPTAAQLDFQLAHAMARDAVHQPWQIQPFHDAVAAKGWPALILQTAVADRQRYLQRPDLGRSLHPDSRRQLLQANHPDSDVAIILSNGLSSTALDCHGMPLLEAIVARFTEQGLRLTPICLLNNARIAVADEIGSLLKAKVSVMIVGERPGLSAADSLGIYLTYAPQPGRSDAERNCLSNIRPPSGMSYQTAASKLSYLTQQAMLRSLSGVLLKDDMLLEQDSQHVID